jgi:hypothetical protein
VKNQPAVARYPPRLQIVAFVKILRQCRVRISPDAEEMHFAANLLAPLPVGV